MTEELAWVIERYIYSELHYWSGRIIDGRPSCVWVKESLEAVRFAREVDAQNMLTCHCAGIGRVTQHAWVKP